MGTLCYYSYIIVSKPQWLLCKPNPLWSEKHIVKAKSTQLVHMLLGQCWHDMEHKRDRQRNANYDRFGTASFNSSASLFFSPFFNVSRYNILYGGKKSGEALQQRFSNYLHVLLWVSLSDNQMYFRQYFTYAVKELNYEWHMKHSI